MPLNIEIYSMAMDPQSDFSIIVVLYNRPQLLIHMAGLNLCPDTKLIDFIACVLMLLDFAQSGTFAYK